MSFVHRTISDANIHGFQSRVNAATDTLWTFYCAANDAEWYEWTPNDAKQTKSVVLLFVIWLRNPSVLCAQSACHHGWVRSVHCSLLHPAMKDPHHSCLVSSNTLSDFSEK
ncbi:hypothetical protein TNCV_27771 [Trichonephila clavipes]|uniref:Uncharacterized protein n=1 Tax=Trichonephila clavipes TaxID=2585209 RepID=A0A8X7BNA3_TRICX|nr:hypothetical protein TNCV_27771 [Trichonephila clavipes]